MFPSADLRETGGGEEERGGESKWHDKYELIRLLLDEIAG